MYYIYKITNLINNKIYIGLTTKTITERFYYHLRDSKLAKSGIDSAIRKYGVENFKVEEIDTADTIEELKNKEIYWIAEYNSTNNKIGYNQTIGGEGITGYHHSEESKYKCGSSFRGKKRIKTQEQIRKHKVSYSGHKFSDEVKADRSKKLKLAYKEGRKIPNGKGIGGRKKMSPEEKKVNKENQIGKRWLHNDELKYNFIAYKNEVNFFINNDWELGKNKNYITLSRKMARENGILI